MKMAKEELDFVVTTTKFISLSDAELKVYDANGKQISKHKKKEMVTHAMGEGLVDDGYVTFYNVILQAILLLLTWNMN
jgi:hypothetical protein